MLNSLRHWAAGWVASILIGLLVLSFAIWGIADVFTGGGGGWIAKVGSQEISQQEFLRAFREEVDGISQQAGRRISTEQARAIGLDRQVLDRLTAFSAIEAHADELGLSLSDSTLVNGLKKEPMFQGIDGKFSRERFDGLLRQNGLSEAGLVGLRRRDKLRAEILKALGSNAVVPAPLVGMVHDWREETRTVDYATIDPAKVLNLKDPTDEELKTTYDDNKSRYMSAPVRQLNVLLLAIDALKTKVAVPDQAVKDAYEATKASYDTPEKRRVYQIAFPDVAAAKAAKVEIDGGLSFAEAGKKAGAKDSDIDLGTLTKASLIDPKIADAVFSLEKDAVSDVVEGQFATVLLSVTQIDAGKVSTFDEVKGEVRAKLAGEMALANVQSVYTEIDDGIAAGTPLKEISASLDLPFFEMDAVTRDNKVPSGSPALPVKEAAKIIEAGFAGEVGVELDSVELADGGFAWVEVLGKTPAKLKPFDEVKEEVTTLRIDNNRRKALSELAAKLVIRLNSGTSFETVATEVGGTITTSEAVTRAKIPDGLNESAMTQVFILNKDASSSAETTDGSSRVLFRVKDVAPAKAATEEQLTSLNNELGAVFKREQSQEYIKALQSRYDVQVNEALFKRLTGVDAQ